MRWMPANDDAQEFCHFSGILISETDTLNAVCAREEDWTCSQILDSLSFFGAGLLRHFTHELWPFAQRADLLRRQDGSLVLR